MLTDSQVEAIANEVLSVELGSAGFDGAAVHSGRDYDDDPSLYVTVRLRPRSGAIDGTVQGRAHVALRLRLSDLGEDRITYVRYRRPDDEALIDDDEVGSA